MPRSIGGHLPTGGRWTKKSSYFTDQIEALQRQERKQFSFLEARDTASTVRQIVKASEATRPRLRYVAPWVQGLGVRVARIHGV
jgi:hypothetical protein